MDFYRELEEKLKDGTHDTEALLILNGEMAGTKLLVRKGERASLPENAEVFCEDMDGAPKMLLCGGGHVSMPVIAIGKMAGFHVTVLEDRPKFADAARKAGADQVICGPYGEVLAEMSWDENSYIVIVTRGHRYDTACLYAVLSRRESCAYVGMMGSRRRTAIVKEQMEKMGIDRAKIEQVHAPIGLAIGAETPEEIAVSIMAEIVKVKNKTKRPGGYPKEILEGILEAQEKNEPAVLATIVSRRGSAPRSVGTKMLILRGGQQVGTIGGGCAENEILQKGRQMLMGESERSFWLLQVDMTAEQAEEEGMVCGGTIEVALEKIETREEGVDERVQCV